MTEQEWLIRDENVKLAWKLGVIKIGQYLEYWAKRPSFHSEVA
jgi:hypothetical protein